MEDAPELEDVFEAFDTVGADFGNEQEGDGEEFHGLLAIAGVEVVPGGGVEIGEGCCGHGAGGAAVHFVEHGAAVAAGEDTEFVVGTLGEGGHAEQGFAGFVLDELEGGDGFAEFEDGFDAHFADGLDE